MMSNIFFAPFALFFGFAGLLIGIVGLAITLYAFYDLLFNQPEMESLEKLIWVIVFIIFNILGVLVYFLVVKYMDTNPVTEAITTDHEHRKLTDLERLTELKERGTLTEEEFEEEKKRILNDGGVSVPVTDKTKDEDDSVTDTDA